MTMFLIGLLLNRLRALAAFIVNGLLGPIGSIVLITALVLAFSMRGAAKRPFAMPTRMLLAKLFLAGFMAYALTARSGCAGRSSAPPARLVAAKKKAAELAAYRHRRQRLPAAGQVDTGR